MLLIFFFLLGAGLFVLPQKTESIREKRQLATNDSIHLNGLYPTAEKVMKDQFYFRDALTSSYQTVQRFLSRLFASENAEVVFLNEEIMDIGDGYLTYTVLKEDEEKKTAAAQKGYNLNEFAGRFPDVKTYVYFPTRFEEIYVPESESVSNWADEYHRLFALQLSENIRVERLKLEGISNYKELFFRSDHHWNIKGAYQGYGDIIRMIGKNFPIDDIRAIQKVIDYPYEYYGTFNNLYPGAALCDRISDYVLEGTDREHDYLVNGNPFDEQALHEEYAEKGNSSIYSDYDVYFGDNALLRVYDYHQTDKPNILVFCDSYVNPIKGWLASHFNQSVFVDLRAKTEDFYPEDLMEQYDIDIVLVCEFYKNLFFNGNTFIPLKY